MYMSSKSRNVCHGGIEGNSMGLRDSDVDISEAARRLKDILAGNDRLRRGE
jgi:hypothetical protein